MAVTMTPSARDHIAKQLAARGNGIGVRLGVKTAGCSGLSYVFEFVDEQAPEDEAFTLDDVTLIVDPKSLVYLDGTELDFVKEGLNEGFTFNNPNMKNACGCGESFHI